MVDEDVREIVEAELVEGEKLLWADKPTKRPYPWRGVWRAALWCFCMLFVCYWLFGVIFVAEFVSIPLKITSVSFGLAFLFIGFAMRKTYLKGFLGPKYEIYGLTNKRAIILSPLWKGQQFFNWNGQDHSRNFIDAKELDTIKLEVSAKSSVGTIIFSGWWDRIRYSWYVFPNPETPKILSNLNGFRNVNNPFLVADLFRNNFGTIVITPDSQTHVRTDSSNHSQAQNKEPSIQKIREIKTRRIILFSAFPMLWIFFTFIIAASGWLLLSFFTFPFFFASAVYAIREIIRPSHSYRTNP